MAGCVGEPLNRQLCLRPWEDSVLLRRDELLQLSDPGPSHSPCGP